MDEVTTGLNSAFSKEQQLRIRQSMQAANNISRTSRSEIPSTIDRNQHITEINNEFVIHATIRKKQTYVSYHKNYTVYNNKQVEERCVR